MIAKLIPIVFLVLGMAAGASGALFLKKSSPPETNEAPAPEARHAGRNPENSKVPGEAEAAALAEYVKLGNQFVVPVLERNRIRSLVVLSISLEISPGHQEKIFAREPKLRDSFLEVLFDYSNMGGFAGTFTDTTELQSLKAELTAVARRELGDFVHAVLIEDIMRQDN